MFEFEKTVSKQALLSAWKKVKSKNSMSVGTDGISIEHYSLDELKNIDILHFSLANGLYIPYREIIFESAKKRKVFISCVEDKIVQTSVAQVIYDAMQFNKCVHGFIKNRSIYTANAQLRKYIAAGRSKFYKMDIKKFYESIDIKRLVENIRLLIPDPRFIKLVELLLSVHKGGISTGSCLSPVLSNVFLADFDINMVNCSGGYIRYVDDAILLPEFENGMNELINDTGKNLEDIGLSVNQDKSRIVDVHEGFKYLGFDIRQRHKDMESCIKNRDFKGAFQLCGELNSLSKQESENTDDKNIIKPEAESNVKTEIEDRMPLVQVPGHIAAIVKKCHIIRYFVDKAVNEEELGYPEKQTLLHIFHCLGEEGDNYIHKVLSYCTDYNYDITQNYIKKCRVEVPLGCKKLCERFPDICDKKLCTCNFSNERLYPTPVIHALRNNPGCYNPDAAKELSKGHFKGGTGKKGIPGLIESLMDINKKQADIAQQQSICKDRINELFKKNNIFEFQTSYGLVVKTEEGIFLKLT